MKRVWLTFALLTSALPTFAYAQGQPRKIEVRATGEVTVPIDTLRLPLELTTSGQVFAKAKDRNDQLLESLQAALTHELPRW